MAFLTPELFDALVLANLMIGIALISVRFYRDMTRRLPPDALNTTDTKPSAHTPERNDDAGY